MKKADKNMKLLRSKRLFKNENKHQIKMALLSNLFGAVALVLVILLGNNFYSKEAQKYTRTQVIETMNKVSVAMSSSFTERFSAWHDELSVVEQFVSLHEFKQQDEGYTKEVCDYLSRINFKMFDDVGVLTEEGVLILSAGDYYDVADDISVSKFLKNRRNHTCITPDIENLKDSLLFLIPYEDELSNSSTIAGIVGAVSKTTAARFLETDAFGSNYAYVVLADEKGNVLVDTQSKRSFGENLVDTFTSFADSKTVKRLESDLKSGKRDIMELMGVTERFLMYYTPIEHSSNKQENFEASTDNWRLLILTSAAALNKNIVEFSDKSKILLYSTLIVMTALLLGLSIILGLRNRKLLVSRSIDSLTGLLNPKRFKSDANFILSSGGEKYAVLSVNIVRFKMINNKLGHINADKILRAVGKNIKGFLRDDELVSRTYSDHFAVLLNMETEQGEDRINQLDRMLTNAEYPYDCHLTFNIGVCRITGEDRDIIVPLDNARHAQQSLKKAEGRDVNIIYYDDKSFEKHKMEMILAEIAQKALDNKEFVVYYQLKRGVGKNGKWVGCEALVRWINDEYGFLSPGIFIDLFERNGFIVKLDLYVFETVCRDLKKSIDEGKKVVPVSINVSKVHFNDKDFLKEYEQILEKYQIPRELIEFEITENLAINNTEQVHEAIEQIHKMGCRCALDDFGTGYSSFDMVINFKLDTIKLDASLFRGSTKNIESRKEIIKTLIDLTHRLDMEVVAEGIETEELAEFLEENKCDVIQGYLYAKPVPYSDCRAQLDTEE